MYICSLIKHKPLFRMKENLWLSLSTFVYYCFYLKLFWLYQITAIKELIYNCDMPTYKVTECAKPLIKKSDINSLTILIFYFNTINAIKFNKKAKSI